MFNMLKKCLVLALYGALILNFSVANALESNEIARVSTGSTGGEGNRDSWYPVISANGRYVTFESEATNLVQGDTNFKKDIFIKDSQTGQTFLISTSSLGIQGNEGSYGPASISADGRYIAFSSYASNLVPNDTNGKYDVFLKDTQTGKTTRVSTDSADNQANDTSMGPSISGDGRYIAFRSWATNLISGTNSVANIFLKDMQTGSISLISSNSTWIPENGNSSELAISGNGQYVAFSSQASNLVLNDNNGKQDVFIKNIQTGETSRVSTSATGQEANDWSEWGLSISADGRYVAFSSRASNLVAKDINRTLDIFVKDTVTGEIKLASTNANGEQVSDCFNPYDDQGAVGRSPSISGDGKFVTFTSDGVQLDPPTIKPYACTESVYVKNLQTGEIKRVSITPSGENASGNVPFISNNGQYVAFASFDSDLVEGDTNNEADVFVTKNIQYQEPKPVYDLGFKPNPDGWGFDNYTLADLVEVSKKNGNLPANATDEFVWNDNHDYYWSLFQDTFNKSDMTNVFGQPKIRSSWIFNNAYKSVIFGGHCDGFASSSLGIFTNSFDARDPIIMKGTTHNQESPKSVTDHIAGVLDMYHARQLSVAVKDNDSSASRDIAKIYEDLKSSFSVSSVPVVLSMMNFKGEGGHSVTPYKLGDVHQVNGEDHVDIYIYDNNYSGETKYIDLNLAQKTFDYPVMNWNSSNSNIILTPLSLYSSDDGHRISILQNLGYYNNIFLSKNAQAVYSNESGQMTGFKDGQYLRQIPDASVQILPGYVPGQEGGDPTIAKLPAGSKYTADIKGTKNGDYDFGVFENNSLITIDDASVTTNSKDQVSLGANGEDLTLTTTDDDKTFSTSFDKEDSSESKTVKVQNIHLKKGETAAFNISDDYKTFEYKNTSPEARNYNLELSKVRQTNEALDFSNIQIPANSKQVVKIGSWDDFEKSPVSIETYDANGKLTNTEQLFYFFHDDKNNTSLKINLHNKDFQFSAGGKDYPLIHDPNMTVRNGKVWINYKTGSVVFEAVADTNKGFATAILVDLSDKKLYRLLVFGK